jgi:hypothetical protein
MKETRETDRLVWYAAQGVVDQRLHLGASCHEGAGL